MLEKQELLRRAQMISGAFFDPHAMERAEDRLGMHSFDKKEYEQKIIELEGRLYWDTEYENYQLVLDDFVIPFFLKVHDSRPGFLAYVKTTLPSQEGFRERSDRFHRLDDLQETHCPCCGIDAKSQNTGNG